MKIFVTLILSAMLMIACSSDNKDSKVAETKATENVELSGAGATFPYPLYSKLFNAYYKLNGTKVNYQAIGSGGGIKQIINGTVDFGGTDAFMNEKDMSKIPGGIAHIPTCLGAVVITYNLEGSPVLKFTGEIVADIFLGKIKKWNDPKIKALNPEHNLPNQSISVVHRSDGSGTTFIFSDYMSKISAEWKEKVGTGKSLKWPGGIGGKGNQGVAGLIQQTPGAFGYAELIYATSNDMPAALIQNKSGNFVAPSVESVSLAANIEMPDDTRVSLTNTDAEFGYPMSSFTWLILYKQMKFSDAKAQTLMQMVDWMIHDGRKFAEPLHYAPLPDAAVDKAVKVLRSIRNNGKP
ncbi:MAG: phosphate ABC transporter substrate-binding protein PstS, partial [Chlorobi bacterium]|nr:phosphate ABC transporter substrate-binding protein PstS [Chlorobiota bacterium]